MAARAARNWEIALSRSPAFRKRRPELVAKTAACSLVFMPGKFAARARFGGGSRGIAGLAQNGGKSGLCSSKLGLKTDGLAQGGRGFRKFSLLFEDRAESVVGLGIIGLGANGGSQFAGGIVEFTLLPEGDRVYGASGCEGSRDSAL